jgi:hypothetical protein
MKKPIEYLKDAINIFPESDQPWFEDGIYDGNYSPIIIAIQAAQEDAIRETVEECLKSVELFIDYKPIYSTTTLPPDIRSCGIKKDSILSVADKLIKKL